MRDIALSDALYEYVVGFGTRETRVQRELRALTQKLPMSGMQIGAEHRLFRACWRSRCRPGASSCAAT